MTELTHFDEHGASRMVDTSAKPETLREARASGLIRMAPATLTLIRDRGHAKGDVLEVARLAGIMAAKKTGELIPLCHPLPITAATVDFAFDTGASFDLVLPTPSTPGDQLFIQGDVHGPGVHINAVTDDVGNTWTNPDFGQASNVILEFWACQADRAHARPRI